MTNRNSLRPFLSSHLGFDNLFKELEQLIDKGVTDGPSYPPYNLYKDEGGFYIIEMAVAGFTRDDIKIEHDKKQSLLSVSATAAPEEDYGKQLEVIRRGLAKRAFSLSFKVADNLLVKDATLENGILTIYLMTIQKEEDKPVLISIN